MWKGQRKTRQWHYCRKGWITLAAVHIRGHVIPAIGLQESKTPVFLIKAGQNTQDSYQPETSSPDIWYPFVQPNHRCIILHLETSNSSQVCLFIRFSFLSPGEESEFFICSKLYISICWSGLTSTSGSPLYSPEMHKHTQTHMLSHTQMGCSVLERCKPCGKVALIERFMSLPKDPKQCSRINTAHIFEGVIKFSQIPGRHPTPQTHKHIRM